MGLISRVSSRTYRFLSFLNNMTTVRHHANDTAFRTATIDDIVTVEFDDTRPFGHFDSSQIHSSINNGQKIEALKNCIGQLLSGIPEDLSQREEASRTTTNVMAQFKKNEIQSYCSQSSFDELDLLMRMVYKGFELSSELKFCSTLFTWHEEISNKAGTGSILRAMT